jgi:transcriptional regulator with XRE-family HTH domain
MVSVSQECEFLRIIRQYGGPDRRYVDVARDMARISLQNEMNSSIVYTSQGYRTELEARTNIFKADIAKWRKGVVNSRPKIDRLFLLSKAVGEGSLQTLEAFFRVNCHDTLDTKTKELNTYYNFQCLEIEIITRHREDYSLRRSKRFIIQALCDNLSVLENFDFYKCIGEPMQVDWQDDRFELIRKELPSSYDNNITLKFHQPLQKEQIVEFTVSYFCPKLAAIDATFTTAIIWHPTDSLIVDCRPPDPSKSRQAKFYEYENRSSYFESRWCEDHGDLLLDKSSKSFKFEVPDPCIGHHYQLRWG